MEKTPAELYLDLMKKTLAFTLWPEPPRPLSFYNSRLNPIMRMILSTVHRILKLKQLILVHEISYTQSQRIDGTISYPGYADTMIGIKRLDNIQFCIETAIREKIEGDLIETGVWRGGACIFMRAVLAAYGVNDRKVYVADSFEGLPKPDTERYLDDKGDEMYTMKYFSVAQKDVEDNFKKYGLLDNQVVFLKGWFKDTLPNALIDKLAVLRLDGDMYSSTMDALTNLYPKLSKGGFCIIDDYGCIGRCRKAVDDFRTENGIVSEIKEIDWTGRYWRKD
jgi:hypothetical protein